MKACTMAAVLVLLAACTTTESVELDPENDRSQPLTALGDNVLAFYFASDLWDGTYTCIAGEDGREAAALAFAEEARLMARHISLSPFDGCALIDGEWINPDSQTTAHVIELHGLSCPDADHCTAFVRQSRGSETFSDQRIDMTYMDGAWSFAE